ncbi:glycoside hydrolase family 29 [bacterium]|nr:glycoside hydrolase family 29 [bacterium]
MSFNRRQFMQTTCAALLPLRFSLKTQAQDEPAIVKPLPKQAAWQDLELGLVYHFDLDVYMPGGHHHERSRREVLDPSLYTPAKLDTDQWLEAAKAMGCKYAIFTATHHQGFLQWQSDIYPFGVKQAPWRDGKGDVVKDFVESCHKYGIQPGVYIGIRFNAYWDVYQYKVNGGKGGNPEKQKEYIRVCEQIVKELCTRYGDWVEVWFDGGVLTPQEGGPDVLPIVDTHQPHTIFYHSKERAHHRWAGSENGTTGYPCWSTMPNIRVQKEAHIDPQKRRSLLRHGDANGSAWCPAWCDAPIREHDWLWVPNHEHLVQPLGKLMDMYYKSVGRNGNLMLGAVPDKDGLIPEPDFKRYAEFGREIRKRFSQPIAETAGQGNEVVLELPCSQKINHVIIMEEILEGERVRAYRVDALTPSHQWQTVCEGQSIGHKRIQQFKEIEAAKVRLTVKEAIAKPRIRRLSVFSV